MKHQRQETQVSPSYKRKCTRDELFTASQVQAIVFEAVQRKEAEMRAEYDKRLQEILDAQYIMFLQYNREQHILQNDLSYLN